MESELVPANLSISRQTTEEFEATLFCDRRYGADLRFLGVVRHLEHDQPILGIEYSCYETMAMRQLVKLWRSLSHQHPNHAAWIHHRIGFVAAGEPSILIRVQTPHSAEGFTLCETYLKSIKTTVPIWKHPVFQE